MNHNIRFFSNVIHDTLVQIPFCEEKSVQLVRVASFQSDFLQNLYFRKSTFCQKVTVHKLRFLCKGRLKKLNAALITEQVF